MDQGDMPVVGPPDEIRGAAGFSSDLEDLGIPFVLPDVVTLDDEPVPDVGFHGSPLPGAGPDRSRRHWDHEDRHISDESTPLPYAPEQVQSRPV